ncbi:MAG: 4-hydroxy-3-methylbut-2-enyl diphosphate reductase [Synergistaceae bacterium]|jgi:4-hydroxy-3-methylbut-2-enyl diphosphate reductase|nr:4-hydroxy-3-methylbut-2-enyl diphosphate reductase [Synergistaceae bacterium]
MADRLGFCFGVKQAVDDIVKALKNVEASKNIEGSKNVEGSKDKDRICSKGVWSIGMPIHNSQEVARLQAMGLRVARDASEIPDGANVLIRAHGEARSVLETLRARGTQVIDTTCPFVRRAQKRAGELSSQGYHIVLLGDVSHPEIRSIMGHVNGAVDVVASVAEVEKLPRLQRVALVSQTTQREDLLAMIAETLVLKTEELCVCNTICKATVERQDAVRRLAGRVDGMILVGSKESANTTKLRDIAGINGMAVLWIESAGELDKFDNMGEMARRWFEGRQRIGIAAGASTPEWLITEVCNKIARM